MPIVLFNKNCIIFHSEKHRVEIRGWGRDDPPSERYGFIKVNGVQINFQTTGLHVICIKLDKDNCVEDIMYQRFQLDINRQNMVGLQVRLYIIYHKSRLLVNSVKMFPLS